MNYSNALHPTPSFKRNIVQSEQIMVTNTVPEQPILHHKKRFSLFYRSKQRKTL